MSSTLLRSVAVACFVPVLAALSLGSLSALADSNAEVASQLSAHDVYITNKPLPAGAVRPGDLKLLQSQVNAAAAKNVDEKLAVVSGYPSNFKSISAAAASLQTFLDYSGVLILVSPHGMGIASDQISTKSIASLVARAKPLCGRSYTDCAVLAGKMAVPAVRSEKNNAFHNAIVFVAATLVGLALIIAVLVLAVFRRRRILPEGTSDSASPGQSAPIG